MILKAGTMLQERYEVLERIGSGGMSEVYKAKCHKLNRLVALKVLKAEFTSDAGFVSKFKMEAQAAAGLSHPNIVNIYDVVDEGDLHFIVMELVEGITLKNYILKKGRLDGREAIGIAIQVAQGIEAAHEQHIIHRDIKPQNMLISKDGKVKVADFGIARAVSSQTMSSSVVGSVHYISPEQARGGYSDERSDLYSLGISMFEMVTGRLPFDGENTVTVALAHLEEPLPLPSSYNPEVPAELERIILRCTEKRPEGRYRNADEVIRDLRHALLSPDVQIRTAGVKEKGKAPLPAASVPQSPNGGTIRISDRELELIQLQSEKNGASKNTREPERRDRQKTVYKKGHRDEEATQLEKLLTALGVIAAIIVVAVVLVFLSRLGGVMNRTTPADETTESQAPSTEADKETQSQAETTLSQKEVRMPGLVGDTQEEAEAKLKTLDLSMQVELEASDDVEKGVVLAQREAVDSVVPRYSKVTVVVSSGSDKVELSNLGLTGMTLDTAVLLLEGKGLKTSVAEEASETIEAGTLIRFEPADKVAIGGTVRLYVSTGPAVQTFAMPGLEGLLEDEAQVLIDEYNLNTGEVSEEYSSEVGQGRIIRQGIAPGQEIEPGATVDYVLSLGPKPVKKQFIASLEASYPLMVSFGPGAGSAEIQILVRLKQRVNGQDVYTKLTDVKSYSSDTTLDIRFDRIRGADGVLTGEVEIVDLTNNVILTSYNVNFTETEVSE
ncbi:MAG: Stk1 family PASTA domain-containing Ser/Thr kinase [Lachnospiraceae bacterium]|nr:Stk1 family PASTA domain-containing Ser/Thr kinase [Lachnospiraceae bacterium]